MWILNTIYIVITIPQNPEGHYFDFLCKNEFLFSEDHDLLALSFFQSIILRLCVLQWTLCIVSQEAVCLDEREATYRRRAYMSVIISYLRKCKIVLPEGEKFCSILKFASRFGQATKGISGGYILADSNWLYDVRMTFIIWIALILFLPALIM